jgi:hypothetical protein
VQGREFDSSTLHLHFGVLAQLVERALSNFFFVFLHPAIDAVILRLSTIDLVKMYE